MRNSVRRSFTVAITSFAAVAPTAATYSVPMTDAARKPSTNFGNRSHSWAADGRADAAVRSTRTAK